MPARRPPGGVSTSQMIDGAQKWKKDDTVTVAKWFSWCWCRLSLSPYGFMIRVDSDTMYCMGKRVKRQ
jgi:hypothetical protein